MSTQRTGSRISAIFIFLFFSCRLVHAQWNEEDLRSLPLADLSAFRPQAGNWSLAGDAAGLMTKQHHLETNPGTGVLINQPSDGKKDALVSVQEFGDLDIQFDFMMPKGSNSGIYLMGRYEVQLFDSWGKANPTFADCGGIYQRWNPGKPAGKEGFEGLAPLQNACRAPGLWQTMKISFEAPAFDASGKKTKNAKITGLWLNGVRLHSNVELSGPTRGPFFSKEKERGPFIFQGDHGPVAIRNIRYAEAGAALPEIRNLHYEVYYGPFLRTDAFLKSPVQKTGPATELDRSHAETEDEFLIRYKGDLLVKSEGRYRFTLEFTGKAILKIGDSLLIDSTEGGFWYQKKKAMLFLKEGNHPIEVLYFKTNSKARSSLGLWYSGPGIKLHRFHAEASLNAYLPGGQLMLPLENETYVQRSFFNHLGRRIPYGMNVCTPEGIHYSLNLRSGRLLRAWRSDKFGEISGMWVDRGASQNLDPAGAATEFPETAFLALSDAEFYPDSLLPADGFHYRGYDLRKKTEPVFHYEIPSQNSKISLKLKPSGNGILTEIEMAGPEKKYWHAAASGNKIEATADGGFRVNGEYYVFPASSGNPARIENRPGRGSVLLFEISTKGLSYTTYW